MFPVKTNKSPLRFNYFLSANKQIGVMFDLYCVLNNLKQKAKQLKSELQVLLIAYKDKRTPWLAKLLVGITVAYLLSPIDLIPDFIPVLGLLDDVIIVPLLITASLKLIPQVVLTEARNTAKLSTGQSVRKNWIFGIIIMSAWLMVFLFLYRRIGYLWK